MHAHPFPCPQCGRRMGVRPEQAGRPVRCPYCKQVVVAPAAGSPVAAAPRPAAPPLTTPAFDLPPRERAESIFAEPGDGEELFEAAPIPANRVQMPDALPEPEPPLSGGRQPPEGLTPQGADAPRSELIPPAAPQPDPWEKLHDLPTAPPPAGAADPVVHRLWLALVVVTAYAAAATVVGAWGWLR